MSERSPKPHIIAIIIHILIVIVEFINSFSDYDNMQRWFSLIPIRLN